MTPTERAAFEEWRAREGYVMVGEDFMLIGAAWGIAYERKRAAGVARAYEAAHVALFEPDEPSGSPARQCAGSGHYIAAEIEKGEP